MNAVVPLTKAERRVYAQLVTDQSYKEIAAHLGVGPKTIKFHVTTIYQKLGVRNRVGLLVQYAGGFARPPENHNPPQVLSKLEYLKELRGLAHTSFAEKAGQL